MDSDVLGKYEHFVEGRHRHTKGLGAGFGEVRIVSEHLHAESVGALGDFGADAAKAEDAEVLAEEFGAREGLAVPLAFAHRLHGFGYGAGQGEQVRERQLSGRDGVARRGVHHDDAAFGGGIDVDVVDAHTGTADANEARGGGEDFAGDLGLRTDQDGVHVGDEGEDLLRGRAIGFDDLITRLGFEEGDPGGGNFVGDEYLRHDGG